MDKTEPVQDYGRITILAINNQPGTDPDGFLAMAEQNCRVVYYPDCQQLILWLPVYYTAYRDLTITDEDGQVYYTAMVSDIVNGSVQILLDTLFLPCGRYTIHIHRTDGGKHEIQLQKQPVRDEQPLAGEPNSPPSSGEGQPIVYRDGNGRILPDEDLLIREKVMSDLYDRFVSKVTFYSTGRDGYLVYREGEREARFEMEMGGGHCMFFILLPPDDMWGQTTGFPLNRRPDIVDHIARMTQRDQAGGAEYRITEHEIIYFRK